MTKVKSYSELDEIQAPEDLPDVGVKKGDRGVVLETFYEHSKPAVMVEHADDKGRTKAMVFYSPDARHVYDVIKMRD